MLFVMREIQRRLRRRLGEELDDPALAKRVVSTSSVLTLDTIGSHVVDGIATSPLLSYTPSTIVEDRIDCLWIFAHGYRRPDDALLRTYGLELARRLEPGPVNEELAKLGADIHLRTGVPIVAELGIANVLFEMGIDDALVAEFVVEPDHAVLHGTTPAVVHRGIEIARAEGIDLSHAGVLAHADHAVRCQMTLQAAGIAADTPKDVALPGFYDAESREPTSRTREAFIRADLSERAVLIRHTQRS